MRVSRNTPPPGAFAIEQMPGKPGKARIRFFENAEQIIEKTHWEYDQYSMTVPYRSDLAEEIENNFDDWLGMAKYSDQME